MNQSDGDVIEVDGHKVSNTREETPMSDAEPTRAWAQADKVEERPQLYVVDKTTEFGGGGPILDESDGSRHYLDNNGTYTEMGTDGSYTVEPMGSDEGRPSARRRWETPRPPGWLTDREAFREVALSDGAEFLKWFLYTFTIGLVAAYVKLVLSSPAGLIKAAKAWRSWVGDAERYAQAREDLRVSTKGDVNELNSTHDTRVKNRLKITVGGAVAVLAVAGWTLLFGNPVAMQYELAALAIGLPALGWWGRDSVEPILLKHLTINANGEPKITIDLILEALADIGVGKGKDAKQPVIVEPPIRTKTGWECVVDLPGATPVEAVLKRRNDFAAALRRTTGKVWLSQAPDGHAARLRIVVNRKEMREGRLPECPLLVPGHRFNYFADSVHLGFSEMGEPVLINMAYKSILIGGQAGSGKTVAMNQIANALALDSRVEMYIFDNKGGTDFGALGENVAHVWRAGSDPEDQEAALQVFRDLNRRMNARYKNLHTLGGGRRSPKTTDDLAARRDLDYHPIVIVVDEVQEWFEFGDHKAEFTSLIVPLIKKGRAMGFTFIFGTQEVKGDTIPRPITGQCKWRYCLMVADHNVSETILGTGTYARGIRPSDLTAEDIGIGYVGTSYQDMSLVRGFYLDDGEDLPDNESSELDIVAKRARTMREDEGRLSGLADGDPDVEPDNSTMGLLDRVATAFQSSEVDRLQWPELLDILQQTWPDVFADTSIDSLSSDVRTASRSEVDTKSGELIERIRSVNVRSRLDKTLAPGKGIRLSDLQKVLSDRTARPTIPEDADPFLDDSEDDEDV